MVNRNSKLIIGLVIISILVYLYTNIIGTTVPNTITTTPLTPSNQDPNPNNIPGASPTTPTTPNLPTTLELPFETLSKSPYCSHEDKKDYIVKTDLEYIKLWNIVTANSPTEPGPPKVNFGNEMVLFSFLGTKSTGGYGIEITKIVESQNQIEVYVSETTSGSGIDEPVTTVLTEPCHFIKTKRSDKPVIFKRI